MNKRILFVDDEPLVLQGLQRTMRPMRQEWDMDFAGSGAEALERMAVARYEVVVSDMIMPGMDGAQLLTEIQRTAPDTIRLILSGSSGQQYATKCVGVAHQYLSKPCDTEALKNTLARLTSLDFAARSEAVRSLLPRLERLPAIPAVYSEIVRLLNDPEVSMEEVGAAIAKDMATTAQILKVVNSSFFGLPRRVSDPVEAAFYLGGDTVKAVVLATNVFGQFAAMTAKHFSIEALSQHSQQVGAAARIIARAERVPESVVSECLVAGLLHDAGKLVLVANLPEQFRRASALVTEGDWHPLDAEREVFGTTHAEVAAYLFGLWGLPVPVVEAIAMHHSPQESQARTFSPLTAVHVADALVWERASKPVGNARPGMDAEYLGSLGLGERLEAWRSAIDESFTTSS